MQQIHKSVWHIAFPTDKPIQTSCPMFQALHDFVNSTIHEIHCLVVFNNDPHQFYRLTFYDQNRVLHDLSFGTTGSVTYRQSKGRNNSETTVRIADALAILG